MKVLVLDIETSWVRSLFMATPAGVCVTFLGVHNIRERRWKRGVSWLGMFRTRKLARDHAESYVWAPSRLRRLTRLWVRLYWKLRFGRAAGPEVVVFTAPSGAHLLDVFPKAKLVYYVHDPFEYYSHLNPAVVRRDEQRLLDRCDEVVAVSKQLQADLSARRTRPVRYLPNATDPLNSDATTRPSDMPDAGRIVGCVGQINATYDWPLIRQLAELLPDLTFVFIGPNTEGESAAKPEIDQVLSLPNVRSLGPKPPSRLMAYMSSFDVCFCPLRRSPHNDRRSPLRLYDYLRTDRPVVSTDVAEAYVHEPHVLIARDANGIANHLRHVFDGRYEMDLPARRAYMARQTWHDRAAQLVEWLRTDLAATPG